MLSKTNLLGRATIGDWFPFFGTTLPAGFLWCDGQSLLRTDPLYAPLFAAISTRFGAVDGTHFSVPDTRGSAVAHFGTAEATPLAGGGSIPSHALSASFNNFTGTYTSTLSGTISHSHTQSASHSHRGGGFNATHTHPRYHLYHITDTSDSIQQANTGTQPYYTDPVYLYASSGTPLTATNPSVGLNSSSINVTLGNPVDKYGTTHSGTATAHDNMMPYMVVPFIIKYAH